MSTLAQLRLRFVDIIGRLDFLTGGKATNTDNGANDFLQRAVRELDLQAFYLAGGDKNRKFVKVLAVDDYTFTIPEFLELDGLRMITATGERDMTDGRLDLREFRNAHERPYSDWTSGVPIDWAINDDILQEEQESSIPEDSLGQDEVRRIRAEGEMVTNGDFSDVFIDADLTDSGSGALTLKHRVPNWQMNGTVKQQHNRTTEAIDVDGAYTAGDFIIKQIFDDMRIPPTEFVDHVITVVISNYVSGAVNIECSGVVYSSNISSNATKSGTFNFIDHENEPYIQIISATTDTVELTIESVSITEIGDIHFITKTDVEDVESRKGIIFFPPTDEARTVEVYGKFFTPTMTRDTDVNFWSTKLPDLVAFKAAELYYSDLGNSARVKHFMDLIAQRLDRLDSVDALREDNDAAGINQEPFRGVPEKWAP